MKRTPMRRISAKRQARLLAERKPVKTIEYTPKPRTPVRMAPREPKLVRVIPKAEPIQHQGYMRLVRGLPCARCRVTGHSQFCHADEGKGIGIKSDCRLGWPGCGPHDGMNGCHYDIGTARVLPKQARREFEANAASETRAAILAAGLWPVSLPLWDE